MKERNLISVIRNSISIIFNLQSFFILLITGYVLLSNCPVLAEDIPVKIKADTLKYVEESGVVMATGSVEVTMENISIKADTLTMDPETNVVTAEGNVVMHSDEYLATADFLYYDVTNEVSGYTGFKSKISPKKISGDLFISAKEIVDLREKMEGKSGSATTCDRQEDHFHVKADKLTYYPNDKIVGHNVTLYTGEIPVFWLPYLYYPLDGGNGSKRNWVFGHNDVEGDYVKSTWGVPFGIAYLDYMQHKGFGFGADIPYALIGLGLGSLYLYKVDEQDTGARDLVTRWHNKKQLNPETTLTLDHNYASTYLIPAGRREQTSFGLGLKHKGRAKWGLNINIFDDRASSLSRNSLRFNHSLDKVSTNYNLTYDYSRVAPKWIRTSQRLSFRRPLWRDNVTLSTKIDYYNNSAGEGEPADGRLEPMFEVRGKEVGYSWAYRSNWYIDTDKDSYRGDDSHQFLEKLPEIDITPNAYKLPLFTLRPSFGYGYYREVRYVSQLGGNRDFTTNRYRATLNADKRIPLALGTVAVLWAGIDQFMYGPGDQLYAYRESLRLNTNLFGFYKNNLSYSKGTTDGNTPFLFDQLGSRYHSIRDTMTFYYLSKVVFAVDGGRNWQTHKWFDVGYNLRVRPDKRISWRLRTAWDVENQAYRDLVNNLTFNPVSYFGLGVATVSDLNIGGIKSGSLTYDMLLLEGQPNQWKLKLRQVYDSSTDSFKLRDIMVAKDLHCWELVYSYSDYRKEFSLTFKLKALPGDPIGLSTGKGFRIDSLEKGLEEGFQDIKQEGAIRRY